MRLPQTVIVVINKMYQRFGGMLRSGDPDTRREWCLMVAEQLEHEFQDGWGVNRAGEGRPQGMNTIARQRGSNLDVWGLLSGGLDGPNPTAYLSQADYYDVPGQIFIPAVASNHLRESMLPPAGSLEARIVDLEIGAAQHQATHAELGRLLRQLANVRQ